MCQTHLKIAKFTNHLRRVRLKSLMWCGALYLSCICADCIIVATIMNEDIHIAATSLLKGHVFSRTFRSHFGVPYAIVNLLWHILEVTGLQYDIQFQAKHLLWALHFLKIYPLQDEGATFCDCDHKTRNKWIWLVLFALFGALNVVLIQRTVFIYFL